MDENDGMFVCADGHGRFVPAVRLAEHSKAAKRLAKADASVPSMQCPDCKQTMLLTHPRGFDVDVCPCGGIWLDAGEEKLIRKRGSAAGWTLETIFELAFWGWMFS